MKAACFAASGMLAKFSKSMLMTEKKDEVEESRTGQLPSSYVE
jgi:hypothetical protein